MPARRTPHSRTGRGPRSGLGSRPRSGASGHGGRRGGRTTSGGGSARRPHFTNRAAILLVVLAVLVVSYASSMRAYLRQQSDIADLQAQIASARKAIAEDEREKRRWKDPAYVQAQARERFGWVMPGETAYQVIGRDGKPLTGDDTLTDPGTVAQTTPQAWWTKAYGSLRVADHPEDHVKPTPVQRINAPKPKAAD